MARRILARRFWGKLREVCGDWSCDMRPVFRGAVLRPCVASWRGYVLHVRALATRCARLALHSSRLPLFRLLAAGHCLDPRTHWPEGMWSYLEVQVAALLVLVAAFLVFAPDLLLLAAFPSSDDAGMWSVMW